MRIKAENLQIPQPVGYALSNGLRIKFDPNAFDGCLTDRQRRGRLADLDGNIRHFEKRQRLQRMAEKARKRDRRFQAEEA